MSQILSLDVSNCRFSLGSSLFVLRPYLERQEYKYVNTITTKNYQEAKHWVDRH